MLVLDSASCPQGMPRPTDGPNHLENDKRLWFGPRRVHSVTMAAPMCTHRTWLLTLGLLASLALLVGCAVPLGPGYHLHSETVTVRYQPGTSLRVRNDARMENVGNAPLDELHLRAPAHARDGTAVWIDGRQVSAVAKTVVAQPQLAVPLSPPLAQRGSLGFRLEYVIPPPSLNFVLDPAAWFTDFIPPKHLFAKGRSRAEKTELEIFVPAGYRALTTGRSRGVHSGLSGGETEYRYEVRRDDFPPFLVVGKFQQQKIRADGREVVIWTVQPLEEGCAQSIAAHLAATSNLYRSAFGRLTKHKDAIPVIEIRSGAGSALWQTGEFGSVPQGVSFSLAPAELCRQPQRFFPAADRALAATWFGWAVAPEPDARAFLEGGARRYAELIAEEGGNPAEARSRQVRTWLGEYDRLRAHALPIAPSKLKPDSPAAERRMAGIQSALSLIALEDRFGPVTVQHALAHLVDSLRNSTAGLDDIRSAFEEAAGQNLFEFFNQWLGRPDIPAGFRKRYAVANPKTANGRHSISISRRAR